jgi:hypothetical protein
MSRPLLQIITLTASNCGTTQYVRFASRHGRYRVRFLLVSKSSLE